MQGKDLKRPVPLESRRIPLLKKVLLRFSEEEGVLEEVGINLSMTGVFIRTSLPRPVGSQANFRFSLNLDELPIEGLAEVVWSRTEEEGAYRPPGMGLRFLKIDTDSRRQIRAAVEKILEETEAPPELRDLRTVVEETLEGILGMEAKAPPNPIRRLPAPAFRQSESRAAVARSVELPWWRRTAGLVLLLVLAVGAGVGASIFRDRLGFSGDDEEVVAQSEIPPGAKESETVSETKAGDPGTAGMGEEALSPSSRLSTTPSPEGISIQEAASRVPELRSEDSGGSSAVDSALLEAKLQAEILIRRWAKAWSDQRSEEYLAAYSAGFKPPSGLSRKQWEDQRRQRLTGPRFIEVLVDDLQVTVLSGDAAEGRFVQTYRSDRFQDRGAKTLVLGREDGKWRILAERSES